MAIIQVVPQGTRHVVQEDGVSVPNLSFPNRSDAVKAAIKYKEEN